MVVQDGEDVRAKLVLDLFGRLSGVDDIEAKFNRHFVEFFDQQRLVFLETVVEIGSEAEIHAGFPVVHSSGLDDSKRQGFDIDTEITHEVRNQRKPEHVTDPLSVAASHKVARKGRIDVAIRQDDEAGSKSRNDLMFKTIGEIRGIE